MVPRKTFIRASALFPVAEAGMREGRMSSEIDRLVDLITDRVKARIGGAPITSAALKPLREQECHDSPSDELCSGCGMCAARRPWSVRAIQNEGACRVGAGVDVGQVDVAMARMIDHTLLKADATADDVKK